MLLRRMKKWRRKQTNKLKKKCSHTPHRASLSQSWLPRTWARRCLRPRRLIAWLMTSTCRPESLRVADSHSWSTTFKVQRTCNTSSLKMKFLSYSSMQVRVRNLELAGIVLVSPIRMVMELRTTKLWLTTSLTTTTIHWCTESLRTSTTRGTVTCQATCSSGRLSSKLNQAYIVRKSFRLNGKQSETTEIKWRCRRTEQEHWVNFMGKVSLYHRIVKSNNIIYKQIEEELEVRLSEPRDEASVSRKL